MSARRGRVGFRAGWSVWAWIIILVGIPLAGLATAPTSATSAAPWPAVTSSARPVLGSDSSLMAAPRIQSTRPVVVASKPFGESYLLAEIFAQLLEARGHAVVRRLGLGSTEVAFGALRTDAVDVYPEYTGTGLLAILGEEPSGTRGEVFRRVSREFRERWGVRWLPPLGFENTYAVSVRRETAEELGLATLTDLAREGEGLIGGFSPDFLGRDDGLPGLEEAYGLRLRESRSLLQAVKYEALRGGRVDVIDAYSTDGFLARAEVVVLEDDRRFFPPYEAAPLVSRRFFEERPAAVAALTELAGLLDEARMRELNGRVEVEGEPISSVAASALAALGLVPSDHHPADATIGGMDGPVGVLDAAGRPVAVGPSGARAGSLPAYLWDRRDQTLQEIRRHLLLVGISLLAAILVAVPAGLALERVRAGAEGVIRGVGVIQTLPSIALLAFMIPVLGIGVVPAVVALFLYSLFPILRNTYSGVRDADPRAVEAAEALGMTPVQVLREIRLPLAAPVIMAGVRTAAVINVGTATLAAFIGAGGLGDPIVSGLALSDPWMILAGAIPAALLAVVVDVTLGMAERGVAPRGLSGG